MRTLIIIPALNEENNIVRTLEELRLHGFEDIVVIDDGSSDQTAFKAAEAGVKVLKLPFNLGIGAAVQTGLSFAKRCGYDAVVRIDSDGQHDPAFIRDLLSGIGQGHDLVIGSRFLHPDSQYRSSFVRRIGIHFFSWLISSLAGARVSDPTSGFQAFGEKAVELFSAVYPTDFPEPEATVLAKRAGLSVCEVPVKMRSRMSGVSSIRYLRTLYYMVKVTLAILLDMMKPAGRPRG
ncbi:MAG TPA: glycosyltransferase family 2 protein [Candidatus Omnitrophota bacterium]|nr:glycosyltransferase family 2 protein [Candidatus Omnitrophota bacterium]HSA30907.1 glycosyltransferase family 2 protein [Candidatus Omnitrophota bacterium]